MANGSKAKLVLFDLDGTLYLDGVPYPGAIELIEKLRKSDLEYCFVTNNSSIPTCDYLEKMRRIGFPLEPKNMISSGDAALTMLRHYGIKKRLFILGGHRFRAWMEGQGFVHDAVNPEALLIAFDKELDYEKLTAATKLVLKGITVFATHSDPICPPGLPDAGMLIEYFKAACPGVVIQAIAGKPHKWLCRALEERFDCSAGEMVMVGDRVGTDLAFACNNGMRSVLVRNGEPMPPLGNFQPTVVVPRISQMLDEFWPRNLGW